MRVDFAQEQADELEALESIFPEELQMVSETDPKSFTLAITSEESSVPGPDQHFGGSRQGRFWKWC